MKLEYSIRVISGNIQQYLHKKIFDDIAKLKDGSYLLRITSNNTRSEKQNNYIHQLFTLFSEALIDYTGDKQYTPKRVKGMMKVKFLLYDVVDEKTGEITGQDVKHTSDLTKTEMMLFVEEVIQYAAEKYHIVLPYPNEQLGIDV